MLKNEKYIYCLNCEQKKEQFCNELCKKCYRKREYQKRKEKALDYASKYRKKPEVKTKQRLYHKRYRLGYKEIKNKKYCEKYNSNLQFREKEKLRISIYSKKNPYKVRQRIKLYRKNNPLQIKSRNKSKYIKIPINQLCEICNKNKAKEKHHSDYNKPLSILFICKECHFNVHKKFKQKVWENPEA